MLFNRSGGNAAECLNAMHIGHRIREVLDGMPKRYTVTWFAGQLNCERRNAYNIFERRNIDIELLMRISKVLGHDFFADLSAEYKLSESSKM